MDSNAYSRRSLSLQANSASPSSPGALPSSAATATAGEGPVLKPASTSWQQTSSSKAHSQLNPHHHQRRHAASSASGRNSHDFTFSTPEPKDAANGANSMSSSRKRTRTGDSHNSSSFPDANSPDAADLDDGPTKGGHSLRKRARVQYATEQIEDEVTIPNSTSSSASRHRRRHTHTEEDEDVYGPRPKRRNTSHSDTPTSSVRRNPARRHTSSRRYQDGSDPGDFSGLTENDHQWDDHQDAMPAATWPSAESSPSSRVNRTNARFSDQTAADQAVMGNYLNHHRQMQVDSAMGIETAPVMTGDATNNAYGNPIQDEDYYDPDQQLQYEPDHQMQDDSMMDYPDLDPDMDDSHAAGPPPATATQGPDSSMFADDQDMATDSAIYDEEAIAPQFMFDEAQTAEATPPVDPQLMALMDPNAAIQNDESPPAEDNFGSSTTSTQPSVDDQLPEKTPSIDEAAEHEQDGSSPIKGPSATGASTPTRTTPGVVPDPKEVETNILAQIPIKESSLRETLSDEPATEKVAPVLDPRWCGPQPTPVGRWAKLTPYIIGGYTVYPEKKPRADDDDAASEAPSAADKDSDEKDSGKEGEASTAAEETGDAQEMSTEQPTPAINTSSRGSPNAELPDLAAVNSPMPPGEEPEDRDSSQEPTEKSKHYRFRKLNDPEEFLTALQDYESLSSAELHEILQVVHANLEVWQEEYVTHGKTVDDYENAQRRRTADIKYENRTRNINTLQPITWEEPDFAVKGYKAKEKETMTETKYLQAQDRTMAAAYGFEYDPHPSKIGKQNPATQQAGVTTRGRSLRNQPRQTAKATETDVVVGKRQRKTAVQALEIPTQDVSRASTPALGRGGRRRRNGNADAEETAPEPASSFEANADNEATGPGRRKRATRGKPGVLNLAPEEDSKGKSPAKVPGRRGRPKASNLNEEVVAAPKDETIELAPKSSLIIKLKYPRGALLNPATTLTDNGSFTSRPYTARPSTAGSDSSQNTIESNYSFRPKRQKRFRDEPEDSDSGAQAPAKKRTKRAASPIQGSAEQVMMNAEGVATYDTVAPSTEAPDELTQPTKTRIRVMPPGSRSKSSTAESDQAAMMPPMPQTASASEDYSRNGTPASQPTTEGDDGLPKEYRTMTKSEKMSASMKNRWKNGNMAGAVEKRKATLAAKKAAQAANEQRVGLLAPKQPKGRGAGKKETTLLPGENAAFMHQQPPAHPYLAHNHAPHQPIQSMPPLSQQQMAHHSHQLPPHAHQQPPMHHQPIPYTHQEHHQYAPPQHQYGQSLPPQPHHPHHLPPPGHQHHQPPGPPPPPPHHHQMHPHHQPQHGQYSHHEYPGMGRPFSG